MKTLVKLTETALVGETVKEIDVLLDPLEIAIVERGTQLINRIPVVGQPNTMPVSIITFKSGRKLSVKESFQDIQNIFTNLPE